MINWERYGERKVSREEASTQLKRLESEFEISFPSDLRDGLSDGFELIATKDGKKMRFFMPTEQTFEIEKPYQEFDLDYLGLTQILSIAEISNLAYNFDQYLKSRVGLDVKNMVPFMYNSAGFTCFNFGQDKHSPEIWVYSEHANPGLLFIAPSFENFCQFFHDEIDHLF